MGIRRKSNWEFWGYHFVLTCELWRNLKYFVKDKADWREERDYEERISLSLYGCSESLEQESRNWPVFIILQTDEREFRR